MVLRYRGSLILELADIFDRSFRHILRCKYIFLRVSTVSHLALCLIL